MSEINNTNSQWSEANKLSEKFIQTAQQNPDFLSQLPENVIKKIAEALWKMKI